MSRKQDRKSQGRGYTGHALAQHHSGTSLYDIRAGYNPAETPAQTDARDREIAARVEATRARARSRVEAERALPALIAERDDAADLLYRLENGSATWADIDCQLQCPDRHAVALEIATGLLQQAHEAVRDAERQATA